MRVSSTIVPSLLNAMVFGLMSGGVPSSIAQQPPVVSIVTPVHGSLLPLAPVRVRVEAYDDDRAVGYVRVSANGVDIASTFEAPLEATWTPPAPGRYLLTAYAVNTAGLSRQAAPVAVQVGSVTGLQLLRGPFLQSLSSTSVVVCWRTDWFSESRVKFGSLNAFDQMARGRDDALDHAVRLEGLQPGTRYYYSVGTETLALNEPGEEFSFETAPTSARPTRIWAIGDSGTGNAAAAAVRDAYLRFTETNRSEVWLMLGDNAYECGTDFDYQKAVFEMYPSLLRRSCVWPTIGNHDACFAGTKEALPMLEIFTLPKDGQCGGLASGSERYYSFDYANIHFICLDSQSTDRRPGQPMSVWLENDLAATGKDWIVAFWHHPPYSWGTHTSDGEGFLIEMRELLVPILERYGVDLVLCGHSHNYERTFLLNGHYGYSFTLQPGMILNGGSGHPGLEGAYQKPAGGLGSDQGTVYVVCGCSGQGGYFTYPKHPAMAVNLSGHGSMVIDVNGLRMEAKYLTEDTEVVDLFVIEKGMPPLSLRPRLSIEPAGHGAVNLSWPTSLRTFSLESRPSPQSSPWSTLSGVGASATVTGRQNRVWLQTGGTNRIFRLHSAP